MVLPLEVRVANPKRALSLRRRVPNRVSSWPVPIAGFDPWPPSDRARHRQRHIRLVRQKPGLKSRCSTRLPPETVRAKAFVGTKSLRQGARHEDSWNEATWNEGSRNEDSRNEHS